MENNEDAADDENSGWFEVKKKHRSSAKFCIQKERDKPYKRSQTFYQVPTKNEHGNFCSIGKLMPSKVVSSSSSSSTIVTSTNASPPVEKDGDKECLEKLEAKEEHIYHKEKVADSVEGAKVIEVACNERKVITESKRSILEDKALILDNHPQNPLTIAKAEDDKILHFNFVEHGNGEKISMFSSHVSSCYPFEVVASKAVQESTLDALQISTSATWKETNQFPAADAKVLSVHLPDAHSGLNSNHDAVTESGYGSLVPESISNVFSPDPASPVQGIVQAAFQNPLSDSAEETSITLERTAADEKGGMTVNIGKEDMLPLLTGGAETSINSSATVTMRGQKGLQHSLNVGANMAEGEPGESKERFRQRLWCFLFENLNRAVDELYLLCELECDNEQMDEAILVLEEAISDFKDLKCRVGHFENTKKTSVQLEGMPVTVKTDHRRPHALSWEVRRMTTSPQRAEILASSLEAFKKIQLERAGKDMTRGIKRSEFTITSQQIRNGSIGTSEVSCSASKKQANSLNASLDNTIRGKQHMEATTSGKGHFLQNGSVPPQSTPLAAGKSKREQGLISETQKQLLKKDKELAENKTAKYVRSLDIDKKQSSSIDKEKERQNTVSWKSMDAWREKRNWEDILKSPLRTSSRVSYPPSINRRATERARVLHDKLMSPEKKKKSAIDLKKEAEEKHARAMRIRNQLENERLQKLHRTSEKLIRVNEWQAVRSSKLREIMFARHQRGESIHEAYLAQVVRRAGDESSKVNEVRFITSLNEENKKLMLRQKLHDSEMRRAEKLQMMRTKQKEDNAREEAALERRKLLEAEKLQRLVETQRRKEEAQVRREEERKASSAAREAKAVEQLRRKEIRAKAQQEEAELLAQRLAEKLRESEQRRKYYLEQIREKASMDFRDQSSPFQRRPFYKEGQNRSISASISEDSSAPCISDSAVKIVDATNHQSMKRRIKKIRQRLMGLKHDFIEPPGGTENTGVGYRASLVAAKAKIARWVQELQRLRQARKEGAARIGLIVGDIVKFLDGKDLELHASRQAGLLDFISSALPASHISKPEACQVTVCLLRLLRVVLSLPANRSYFLAQNLLPPIIPMLSASLEKYIKVAASSNPGSTSLLPSKAPSENLDAVGEILDGFLWIVSIIVGHTHYDDRELQMQDGLIELIISYQTIHHLRDLFALYDRPQVEGSPFPSSILLGLALLAVLTSRPGTVSSIDWDYDISKNKTQVLGEFITDFSSTSNPFGSKLNPTVQRHVEKHSSETMQILQEEVLLATEATHSDVIKNRPSGEDKKELSEHSSGSKAQSPHKQANSSLVESSNNAIKEQVDSGLQQKVEKSSINHSLEGNGNSDNIVHDNIGSRKQGGSSQPVTFLLTAISDTGLISLLSLLTAVLLQANNRLSSEQGSYILPSNFEEVATGVLKVLNNLANLDITVLQGLLAKSDLKVEFFHLMSFLLTHCTNQWKTANDQVGLLLLESLLLLGYFSLFHPENQAVLRWGESPTILHKVCDLPFSFFSDPELMPILAGTLVAACYGCEQNRGVVKQELSIEMLLSLIRSCKQGLLSAQLESFPPDSSTPNDPGDSYQIALDTKRSQNELQGRANRRVTRASLGKVPSSGCTRIIKTKAPRDSKGSKTCEEWIRKHNLPASEASSTFMLQRRFPSSFLDKAEIFFSAET